MAKKRRQDIDNKGETARKRIGERLRAYFLAGILVTGPILFTLWITWSVVDFIDHSVAKLFPSHYNPGVYFPFSIPGFGLLMAVVALTLIGWLAAGYLGRLFLRLSDRVMKRMPVISGIYSALKQIFETVLAKRSNSFREVVLVEWPRPGSWTVAFVTSKGEGEVGAAVGRDAVGLYVPTTPNPTSGYLIYVSRAEIVKLSMTVEEGLKFVISGGIITPENRPDDLPVAVDAIVEKT